MNSILTTQAIVLRTLKFRDSSTIVKFYTQERGVLSGIVKGNRKSNGKTGNPLEPTSLVSVVVYEKSGREIQTVSQCERIRSFRSLYTSLEGMMVGMAMVEMVEIVAHGQERNDAMFNLLLSSLESLDEMEIHRVNELYRFELRLAALLGFGMTFASCRECQRPVNGSAAQFHVARGGIICPDCRGNEGNVIRLSASALDALTRLADRVFPNMKLDAKTRGEIENLVSVFFRFHVAGYRNLKSVKVFSTMMET